MQSKALVTIFGYLAADAEVRHAGNGTMVTTLRIPVNSKDGSGAETVDWYRASLFGKMAEFAAGCVKGNPVTVSGRLRSSTYKSKDGSTKTSFEISVSEFMDLAPRPAGNDPSRQRAQAAKAAPAASNDDFGISEGDTDDSLPF